MIILTKLLLNYIYTYKHTHKIIDRYIQNIRLSWNSHSVVSVAL